MIAMQLYVTLDKQSPCCKNVTNCRDFLFVYNSIVHEWKIAQVFSSSISILSYASIFFLQGLERVARFIQMIKKNGSILTYSNLCSNGKAQQDDVIIMDSW